MDRKKKRVLSGFSIAKLVCDGQLFSSSSLKIHAQCCYFLCSYFVLHEMNVPDEFQIISALNGGC